MDFGNGTSNADQSPNAANSAATADWQIVGGQPPAGTSPSDSGADDELQTPNTHDHYVRPRIDSDMDYESSPGATHVSVDQINAKSMEYDRIEMQIQEMAQNNLRIQDQLKDDHKKFRQQIKQSVRNRNDEDSDTDDYKDLSSTTTSDPRHSNSNLEMEWNRTSHWGTRLLVGCAVIGIAGVIVYRYLQRYKNHAPIQILRN